MALAATIRPRVATATTIPITSATTSHAAGPICLRNQAFNAHSCPQSPLLSSKTTTRLYASSSNQADSNTDISSSSTDVIAKLIDFLKEDLRHLFDDQGIDRTAYEQDVQFEDPITRYSSIQGYLANIQFLRSVFDPTFDLVDIQQTGPWEITTRWSMNMRPTFVPAPLRKLWNPSLAFTGTSIMGVNPQTGKFNRHVDTWDALTPEQQRYFSLPAFQHVMQQVFDPRRIPEGLESPPYKLLYKRLHYEIRMYEPITVAEAPMNSLGSTMPIRGATGSSGNSAFGALAQYIFGGNTQGRKMAMTTPVLSTRETMQFYLGGGVAPLQAPRPLSEAVEVKEAPGGIFAVATFAGLADNMLAEGEAAKLKVAVLRDGFKVVNGAPWVLARFNDPGTPPPFRRNEVMVPLQEFSVKKL